MVMALGVGRVDRRGVPPLHPCVLQGAALPRRGLGEPLRLAPLVRHEERHGRPAQVHADHVLDVHHRLARARRHLPVRGVLVEGRDPGDRGRDAASTSFLVVGLDRRVPHRRLHDPLRVPHVLRRVPRPRAPARVGAARSPSRSSSSRSSRSSPASSTPRRSGSRSSRSGSSPTVAFPELVHAEFDYPKAIISVAIAAFGIGDRRVLLVPAARSWDRSKGLTRAQQARATPGTRSSRTSTTSTSSTRTSSWRRSRARSRAASTGSTST